MSHAAAPQSVSANSCVARCTQLLDETRREAPTFFSCNDKVACIGETGVRQEFDPAKFHAALDQAHNELRVSTELVPYRALQLLGAPIEVAKQVNIIATRVFPEKPLRGLLVRHLSPDVPHFTLDPSDPGVLERAITLALGSVDLWNKFQERREECRSNLATMAEPSEIRKEMRGFLAEAEETLLAKKT